jgi:ABC-type iron transport system FetAB ATPase subunit
MDPKREFVVTEVTMRMSSITDWRNAPRPTGSVPFRGKTYSTLESAIWRARWPAASLVKAPTLNPPRTVKNQAFPAVVVVRQGQERPDIPLVALPRACS